MKKRSRTAGKKRNPLINLGEARAVMEAAVALANDSAAHEHPEFVEWRSRICAFSEVVADVGYKQSIALLGAALIAKATNTAVDVMILQVGDGGAGAYSARGVAENVLYPASLMHKFDIGSTSRNPLNAATFLGRPRIDTDFSLKGAKGKDLGKQVYDVLSEVSQIKDRESGIRALAAYVHVRRSCVSTYSAASGEPGLTSVDQLSAAITAFVEEKSEGGGRAQAVVGGLFDVRYGPERVRVGKTNEPDRRAPGDVVVGHPILTVDVPLKAVEVRDKAVTPVDVLAIIQKLRRAGVSKGAIIAVAKGQPVLTAEAYAAEMRAAGVQLEIFGGWPRLVAEVIFWSDQPEGAAIREAVRHIRDRAVQIGLSAGAIVAWDAATLIPASPGAGSESRPG
jgi:hypothetical protein